MHNHLAVRGIEDEKQVKEVKRRVVDDEHGRMLGKMIELVYGTGEYLRNMLGRLGVYEECSDDESFIAKIEAHKQEYKQM